MSRCWLACHVLARRLAARIAMKATKPMARTRTISEKASARSRRLDRRAASSCLEANVLDASMNWRSSGSTSPP